MNVPPTGPSSPGGGASELQAAIGDHDPDRRSDRDPDRAGTSSLDAHREDVAGVADRAEAPPADADRADAPGVAPSPRALPGLACMALAVFLFSIMAVSVKLLGPRIPAHEKILLRSVPALLHALWLLRRRGEAAREVFRRLPLLRGLFGAFGMWLYFLSIANLPLGNAVLLTHLSPLFAAAFAARFLGERVGRVLPIAAALCVLGVAAIARPTPHAPLLFSGVALLCAISNGGTYTLLRAAASRHPPMVVVLALPLVATPCTLVASLFHWVPPGPRDWILIAVMIVTSIAAQMLMTLAMRREAAGPASMVFFLGVVLAVAWGQVLGDPALHALDFVGVALVGGGLALVTATRRRRTASSTGISATRTGAP